MAAQESIELKGTITVKKEKKKKKILLETKEKKTFIFANPKQFRKVEKFKGREIKITCYLAGGKDSTNIDEVVKVTRIDKRTGL